MKLYIFTLSLALFVWFLDSSFLPRRPPVVNYDATEYFAPGKVRLPTSEAEITELVKDASRAGQKVRVLGSGHSRNSLASSDGVIISLHNYRGVVRHDVEKKQVTVLGGTTLDELCDWLEEHGLALPVLPTILEQTIAGAISTATHGSRRDYGNMATLVTRMKLVNGLGEVVTVSSEDNDTTLFKAAQVSLGLLGVITEVTLQCEDSYRLKEKTEKSTLSACLSELDKISSSAENARLWTELYGQHCTVYRYTRTHAEVQMSDQLWMIGMKMHLWEPFLWLSSVLPSFAPAIVEKTMAYGKIFGPAYIQVGRSFDLLAYPLYVPSKNVQIELAVSKDDCAAAVRLIVDELKKWNPPSMFTEIRFVSGDDIWMSLNYQRNSCLLTVILYDPGTKMKEGYFDSIFDSLLAAGMSPRAHFGKYISHTSLERDYPRYHDFKAIRANMDPHRLFVNHMLESQIKKKNFRPK